MMIFYGVQSTLPAILSFGDCSILRVFTSSQQAFWSWICPKNLFPARFGLFEGGPWNSECELVLGGEFQTHQPEPIHNHSYKVLSLELSAQMPRKTTEKNIRRSKGGVVTTGQNQI